MADTTGIRWNEVKVADRHGTDGFGQASDGTGTSGNLPKFDANGGLTDSGIAASSADSRLIGFIINDGTSGTDVGPILIAPRSGTVSKCKFVTKASDGTTDLTFTIKQNGTAVFTSSQTIAHGTAGGTLATITALTSVPLAISADDLFTIDISSGTSAWMFTVQLEP